MGTNTGLILGKLKFDGVLLLLRFDIFFKLPRYPRGLYFPLLRAFINILAVQRFRGSDF